MLAHDSLERLAHQDVYDEEMSQYLDDVGRCRAEKYMCAAHPYIDTDILSLKHDLYLLLRQNQADTRY